MIRLFWKNILVGVWSSMRVSKRSPIFHSGINYSFKTRYWKNSGVLRGAERSDCCIFNALLSVYESLVCRSLTSRRSVNRSTRSRTTCWFLITPISSFSASLPNIVHWSLSCSSSLDMVSLRASLRSEVRNCLGCKTLM